MKNVLDLNEGAHPWHPNDSVRVGEVLDELDVPRMGLLHDNGKSYFFTVILGDGAATGIWAYAQLSERDLKELLSINGPEGLDDAVELVLANRPVTLAFASEYKIRLIETLDAGIEGTDGLIERFQKLMDCRMKESQQASQQVRALAPAH